MTNKIPIIVPCYNRPKSLKRLLSSLSRAIYKLEVELILSLEGEASSEVIALVEKLKWPHGKKRIIKHSKRLGLKQHIFNCGDLLLLDDYDAIIVLEDDLFVSPVFYEYSIAAYEFWKDEKMIGGISLYSPNFNETTQLPFKPISSDSDTYLMQLASSWGQIWTKNQWRGFRNWYELNSNINIDELLPNNIKRWPSSSWKKEYNKYLLMNDLYFIYPYESFTTNFGDLGTHFQENTYLFQVPIEITKRNWQFLSYKKLKVKYDMYGELDQKVFKEFNSELNSYDFCVNLNGQKSPADICNPYVLIKQKFLQKKYIKAFGASLKPIEINVLLNIEGDDIFLVEKEIYSLGMSEKSNANITKSDLEYYFDLPVWIYDSILEAGREEIRNKIPIQLRKLYWFYNNFRTIFSNKKE